MWRRTVYRAFVSENTATRRKTRGLTREDTVGEKCCRKTSVMNTGPRRGDTCGG